MTARWILIAIAGVCCGAALGACGGASGANGVTGVDTSASNPQALAASECMRAHGVPNFPDPTKGQGGVGISIAITPGQPGMTVDGTHFGGPVFENAVKVCKFGPPAGGHGPPLSTAQKAAFLASAACMRSHGVPDFPDPTFPAGGGIQVANVPGLNRNSPAFVKAQQECRNVGKGIPGGG